jgi:hypothetical protein
MAQETVKIAAGQIQSTRANGWPAWPEPGK